MKPITTDDRRRLALIDALRCVAALWVVLFHLSEGNHIPTLLAAIPEFLRYIIFDAGHLGVPIFFVLSGIVMAVTTAAVPMTTENAANFVARRLVRLAPPYYAAVAFGVVVIAAKHMSGQGEIEIPSIRDILAHLAFLQDFLGIKNIITVFWTLCIEVQFYVAFAVLLWLANQARSGDFLRMRIIAIWVSALLALLWPTGLIHTMGWQGSFIGFWFSFMTGVVSAQTLTGTKQIRCFAVGYCALVLVVGLVVKDTFAFFSGLTGLLFSLFNNVSAIHGVLTSYPVQRIGLISYSLYLFHSPVTGSFMRLFRRFASTSLISDLVAAILALTACVAFAAIAHVLVERPAIAWSRRIKFRRPSAAVLVNTT